MNRKLPNSQIQFDKNSSPWDLYAKTLFLAKNTGDLDSRYKNLALISKQSQCMKVGSKLYYCCK